MSYTLKAPFPYFGGKSRVPRTKPSVNGYGQGMHRDLRNDLRAAGVSVGDNSLEQYLELLALRLRRVRLMSRAKAVNKRQNCKRERIWFSPHCLRGGGLFD